MLASLDASDDDNYYEETFWEDLGGGAARLHAFPEPDGCIAGTPCLPVVSSSQSSSSWESGSSSVAGAPMQLVAAEPSALQVRVDCGWSDANVGALQAEPSAVNRALPRVADTAPSPKRRRLVGKVGAPQIGSSEDDLLQRVRSFFGRDRHDERVDCGDWTALREHMRHRFTMETAEQVGGPGDSPAPLSRDKREAARQAWGRKSPSQKMQFMKHLLEQGQIPAHLVPLAEAKLADSARCGDEPRHRGGVQCSSVLLTWNGPWGVIPGVTVPSGEDRVNQCVSMLRKHPVIKFLWAQLQLLCAAAVEALGLTKHACSLELCTSSFESGVVRCHAHAFWACAGGLRLHNIGSWTFGSCSPHRRLDLPGTKARGRNVSAGHYAGLYYICAPKEGSIVFASSHQPNKDFAISPEWINTLFQLRKISATSAKTQLALCRKDVARHVQNVEYAIDMERQLAADQELQAIRIKLQATLRPRKYIPLVEEKWLQEQAIPQLRQRFLVLDGKTKCGKSWYAQSLKGVAKTLSINCGTSLQEPDLRFFVRGVHECVVFEEAHACMVIRCKQLFQCAPDHVSLGTSQTQCHAYRVCTHGVLFVVTSNVWKEELRGLPYGDAEWLMENSYVVDVTEPLW